MSHLPSKRLAALVDESPSAAEVTHLAACDECACERAAFRRLAELAASEATRIGAPITRWEQLAPALAADGVIDHGRGQRSRPHVVGGSLLQAAAAVVIAAGGVIAGRYSAGASPAQLKSVSSAIVRLPPSTPDSTTQFASIEDAQAARKQSQLIYQSATAFLAQRDTSNPAQDTPASMRTRLAALDRTRQVMGEALHDSPYDPVINGYYISTSGQREATLQQLNTVMPASMRITSY